MMKRNATNWKGYTWICCMDVSAHCCNNIQGRRKYYDFAYVEPLKGSHLSVLRKLYYVFVFKEHQFNC